LGHNIYDSKLDINSTPLELSGKSGLDQRVTKLINISSSSVTKLSRYYGFTKRLSEDAVKPFHQEHNLNTITLRPRTRFLTWGIIKRGCRQSRVQLSATLCPISELFVDLGLDPSLKRNTRDISETKKYWAINPNKAW